MKNRVFIFCMIVMLGISVLSFDSSVEAKETYITKEQAMKKIKQSFSENGIKKKKTFTAKTYKDVKTSSSIKWAYEHGFISKTKSGLYKPKSHITREQAMKALVRGLDIKASKKKGKTKDARTKELKIMDSWGHLPTDRQGKFNPNGKLTNNQMWVFIGAAMKTLDEYNLTTTLVEPDWYYTQPGEKVPSYSKALDYKGFKKAVMHFPIEANNKSKFKAVYVKDSSYIQKLKKERDSYALYSQDQSNPFIYALPLTPYGAQKKGKVYRVVLYNINFVSNNYFKASEEEFTKMYNDIKKKNVIKTDYDAVVAVNKYVANKFEYGSTTNTFKRLFAGQGSVILSDEYMQTSGYLLKKFGLEVKKLSGNKHTWLGVKVGGNWYHSDPTFLSTSKQETNILMTDSVRFSGKIMSYDKNTNTIKTPKEDFNPSNALPIKVK